MTPPTDTDPTGTPDAQAHRLLGKLVAAVLLLATSAAHAAFTTDQCLVKKRQAWSKLRNCQATEEAKRLVGKPTDFAKCEIKFQEKLAKVDDKATDAVIACRYGDNGDGTVTDYDTGLQWEQKGGVVAGLCFNVGLHCVNDFYHWWVSNAYQDFVQDFVTELNGTSADGQALSNVFAGHVDWRMPTVVELEGIVDLSTAGCGSGNPCIDPTFGPTQPGGYWSATTDQGNPSDAWFVSFYNGGVSTDIKSLTYFVRAVRGGL